MQVTAVKASARRTANFTHTVSIREHQLTVDESRTIGGEDEGPAPEELLAASLASCTAITIEMYAQRKGWDVGPVEIDVEYSPAERGCPTKFDLVLHLASALSDEQVDLVGGGFDVAPRDKDTGKSVPDPLTVDALGLGRR